MMRIVTLQIFLLDLALSEAHLPCLKLNGSHSPRNWGGRFSLKAAMPSSRSRVGIFWNNIWSISFGGEGPEVSNSLFKLVHSLTKPESKSFALSLDSDVGPCKDVGLSGFLVSWGSRLPLLASVACHINCLHMAYNASRELTIPCSTLEAAQ